MTIYRLPFGHMEWPESPIRRGATPHASADGSRERTTRLSVRLPETLKRRVEASAELEGVAPSTWIVRALSRSTDPRLTTL
jgi:predicted HicB family RNase H-like nuclease